MQLKAAIAEEYVKHPNKPDIHDILQKGALPELLETYQGHLGMFSLILDIRGTSLSYGVGKLTFNRKQPKP